MRVQGAEDRAAFADVLATMGATAGGVMGLALLLASNDSGMAFHGLLLLLSGAVAAVYVLKGAFAEASPATASASGDYMDGPIKVTIIASIFWGIAGFRVGDIIAWQLAIPQLNLDMPWTSFGRLRPLHTSAVIFAFGGNVLIGTSLYVVQRTCHARLPGRWAPWFVVWG